MEQVIYNKLGMMMLKYALLGFLSYQPMTGYAIKTTMDNSTRYFWHAELSQIYRTLKRLEREGLVTSSLQPQEGRPARRVYAITEAGRAELLRWLRTPPLEPDTVKNALLLKLFFARSAGKETILAHLRLSLAQHQQQIETYEGIARQLQQLRAQQPALAADVLLWQATLRFGLLYEEMYLRWLQETIAQVEAEFPQEP